METDPARQTPAKKVSNHLSASCNPTKDEVMTYFVRQPQPLKTRSNTTKISAYLEEDILEYEYKDKALAVLHGTRSLGDEFDKDYEILSLLGFGSAFVLEARHRLSGVLVAVKCMHHPQELDELPNEVMFLQMYRNYRITNYIMHFQSGDLLVFMMEAHGQSLLDCLLDLGTRRYNAQSVHGIFRQTAEIVKDLHDRRIVHLDLKPDNIQVDCNLRVKLADFGTASVVTHDTVFCNQVGTLGYMAPEIMQGRPFDGYKGDIWALGVVLNIMFGYPIGQDEETGDYLVSSGSAAQGSSAIDLLEKMLTADVERRLTIDEVLAHPWMMQVQEDINSRHSGV